MRIKIISIIILILVVLPVSACGSVDNSGVEAVSSPVYNDIVKISLYQGINSVDPAYAHTEEEIAITNLVYEGLVKEEDGSILPSLAERWDVSSDGLIYTFYLKDMVYFHNGKEMTADDVKFSFERVLRQKLSGSYVFINIVGADKVLCGESKDLSGVTTSGDYILKIELIAPDNNFLNALASPTAKVLDRLELVEQGVDFGRASTISVVYPLPSGTGPYRLAEWLENKSLSLGSYESYYGEAPYPDRIEYTFNNIEKDALLKLRAGTVSIVKNAFSARTDLSREEEAFIFYEQPERVFRYLVINQDIAPFDNMYLRKAIFDAISPSEIIKEVRQGFGAYPGNGFVEYWYELNSLADIVYNGDLSSARAELITAGYPGGIGVPVLTLLTGPAAEDIKAGQFIVSALAKIGIVVNAEAHSYGELSHLVNEGSAAFYLDQYSDKDGTIDIFFKERVDTIWQKTIKAGSWNVMLSQGYNASGRDKQALFSQVGNELFEQGVLYCLYYDKTITVTTNAYQGLVVEKNGSLDFSLINRNSRKNE